MDLYKIKPDFLNLIDKMTLARELYQKATERVADDFLKDQFEALASKKNIYIKEISNLFDLDLEKHSVEIRERIKADLEKLYVEISDIALNEDEQVILDYSIKREQKINELYKYILDQEKYGDFVNTVIKNQLSENQESVNELKRVKEAQ